MTPKQRGPGQYGGKSGMFSNQGRSANRGGKPMKGGAGSGKTPNKGGCLKAAIPLGAIVIDAITRWLA